jgi:hypothetical protein
MLPGPVDPTVMNAPFQNVPSKTEIPGSTAVQVAPESNVKKRPDEVTIMNPPPPGTTDSVDISMIWGSANGVRGCQTSPSAVV